MTAAVLDPSDLVTILQEPERPPVPAAWAGHVPFAFWLVAVLRPRVFVDLGTREGDALAAVCQQVRRASLATACFGVGPTPDPGLQAFIDDRYDAFACMLPAAVAEAAAYFADGSVDLLHIGGCRTSAEAEAAYRDWAPKLGGDAVVLLHDVQLREGPDGAWRFWAELADGRPHFTFLHAGGLGVLALGAVPPRLQALFAADAVQASVVRQVFASAGGRLARTLGGSSLPEAAPRAGAEGAGPAGPDAPAPPQARMTLSVTRAVVAERALEESRAAGERLAAELDEARRLRETGERQLEEALGRVASLVRDCSVAWTKYGEALAGGPAAGPRVKAGQGLRSTPRQNAAYARFVAASPTRATLLLLDGVGQDSGFLSRETRPDMPGLSTIRVMTDATGRSPLGAVDEAIRRAPGRLVILQSVGERLSEDWLGGFERLFRTHPLTAAAEGIVVGADELVAWSGSVPGTDGIIRPDRAAATLDDYRLKSADVLPFVNPGFVAIDREVYAEVGGMDPALRTLRQGLFDFALRARSAGFLLRRAPAALCKMEQPGAEAPAAVALDGALAARAVILRRQRRPRILVIDAVVLKPDRDAGSMDTYWSIRILQSLGYDVTFIGMYELAHAGRYTEDLRANGVLCPVSWDIGSAQWFVEHRGRDFDAIMLYRVVTAAFLMELCRKHAPDAKVIFHTSDLHFLREERQAAMFGDPAVVEQAKATRKEELRCLAAADAAIVVSRVEYDLVRELLPDAALHLVPIMHPAPGRLGPCEGRAGVVFVGGFGHQPNLDAVTYLCEQVWPLVRAARPAERLSIVGANPPEAIRVYDDAARGIRIVGFVPDLAPYYSGARVNVAPLRFGAGIKGKVIAAMMVGLPTVGTDVAFEGMGVSDGGAALVASDAASFAASILRLCEDDALWQAVSDAGLAFSQDQFSVDAQIPRTRAILKGLGLPN